MNTASNYIDMDIIIIGFGVFLPLSTILKLYFIPTTVHPICHFDLSHMWVTESASVTVRATAPAAHGDVQVTQMRVRLGASEVTITQGSDECHQDR